MKFIFALVVGIVTWILVATVLSGMESDVLRRVGMDSDSEPLAVRLVGSLVASPVALAAAFYAFRRYGKHRASIAKRVARTVKPVRASREAISEQLEIDDGEYLAAAEEEVSNSTYDRALWSKALVKAGGDESRRKITYMKLRAAQLRQSSAGK